MSRVPRSRSAPDRLLTSLAAPQVIGLLLTFKTNSAFGSYSEGRRLWSSVILASRTFARMAWLHCPDQLHVPADPSTSISHAERAEALAEKRTYINLVAAFSVALKHYVRGEPGVHYTDLWPLVAFLPRYHKLPSEAHSRTPLFPPLSSTSPVQPRTASPSVKKRRSTAALAMAVERAAPGQGHELLPARNPPPRYVPPFSHLPLPRPRSSRAHPGPGTDSLSPRHAPPPGSSIDDFVPFYDFFADVLHWLGRRRRRMRREKGKKEPLQTREGGDNVPLELILLLSGWVAALQRRKTIDVPTINALLGALQALSDALTGLERVLLTPMPIAYSLHLRHVIWIYLLLAPSQLHETLGWLTVPATAIISFVFLGLLRLGDQIENPLGYDPSDLDLESFTLTVLRELRELVAHPAGESAPDEVLAALREGAKKAAAVEAAGKEGEEGEGKDGEGEGEQGSEGGKEERLVEEEERREYGEEGWRRV
ncbi:uncharacterized protein RHOBADRAFT_18907 [Rhodotorula graminis WP1]|uniref:Uncharacterized protein n=1 Tax=Rhodotorula graminis (strain WP1) TaxID=578459 RepID=A0A0N8PZB0_RHOGW|nr:uncharacterized protein RHOBADRAFT_18907 [Rhodotorula graminis WP1]KPV71821.1 hypothetical protein RHOBADRAFT_18907 [Rhodotorula graminis WP1]